MGKRLLTEYEYMDRITAGGGVIESIDDEFRPCLLGDHGEPCTLRHLHELHGGIREWQIEPRFQELREKLS